MRDRVKLYDGGFQFSPYIAHGLSPRHHIGTHWLNKQKIIRLEKIGRSMCEICKKRELKWSTLEIHESFKLRKNKYTFMGLHILCKECHDMVHKIRAGSIMFSYLTNEKYRQTLLRTMFSDDITMCKKSFKNKKEKEKNILNAITGALDFTLSDNVKTDYFNGIKYGIEGDELTIVNL